MMPRPPISTLTDTIVPYATLFRSVGQVEVGVPYRHGGRVGVAGARDRPGAELLGGSEGRVGAFDVPHARLRVRREPRSGLECRALRLEPDPHAGPGDMEIGRAHL